MPQSSIDSSSSQSLFAPGSLRSNAAKSNVPAPGGFDELFQQSLKNAAPPSIAEKAPAQPSSQPEEGADLASSSAAGDDSDASVGGNPLAESDSPVVDEKPTEKSDKSSDTDDDNEDEVEISVEAQAADAKSANVRSAETPSADEAATKEDAAATDAVNAAKAAVDKIAAQTAASADDATDSTAAKVKATGADSNSAESNAKQAEAAKQAAESVARAKAAQAETKQDNGKTSVVTVDENNAEEAEKETVAKKATAENVAEPTTDSDGDAEHKARRSSGKEPAVLAKNANAAAAPGIAVPEDVVAKSETKEIVASDLESLGKHHAGRTESTEGASTRQLTNSKTLQPATPLDDVQRSPTFDRSRFVQRVSGAIRSAQLREGPIQVRLSPPDLGQLRIELTVHHGAMTAKLQAETPAARHALLDNLPLLRERLAEHEIHVEKFDVDVRDERQGSPQQEFAQDQQARQSGGRQAARAARSTTQRAIPSTPIPTSTTREAAADGRIDVRI